MRGGARRRYGPVKGSSLVPPNRLRTERMEGKGRVEGGEKAERTGAHKFVTPIPIRDELRPAYNPIQPSERIILVIAARRDCVQNRPANPKKIWSVGMIQRDELEEDQR